MLLFLFLCSAPTWLATIELKKKIEGFIGEKIIEFKFR